MIRKTQRAVFLILILMLFSTGLLTACSGSAVSATNDSNLAMAPMAGMPADVKSAPTTVQQAYQFAAANPDVLKTIPCYCGCGAMGHTSNYSCYISGVEANGSLTYDPHALGCSICVDITQDTMRLIKQGKTVPEIKSYIDQTYLQYGQSNIP
jgi:hypothetical protein